MPIFIAVNNIRSILLLIPTGPACDDTKDSDDIVKHFHDGPFFTGSLLKLEVETKPSEAFNLFQTKLNGENVTTITGWYYYYYYYLLLLLFLLLITYYCYCWYCQLLIITVVCIVNYLLLLLLVLSITYYCYCWYC